MEKTIIQTVRTSIRHWYLLLLVGIIFIATGIWVIATPLSAYLALSFLFSISFLVAGLAEVIFAIANHKGMKGWGWTLVYGLFNLLIGSLLLFNPIISITTLPLYVGFVVLFRSFMAIGAYLDLDNHGLGDVGGLLGIGILGVLFSFILIWNPVFAGVSLVTWTSLALLVAGFYSCFASFRLKKLDKILAKGYQL